MQELTSTPKTKFDLLQKKLEEAYNDVYYIHPFTFELPGRKLYDADHQKVIITPLKGKHEKLITNNLEPLTILKNYIYIIKDSVKWENGDDLNFAKLHLQDYLAIIFLQKLVTYQKDIFESEIECNACKGLYSMTLNVADIQIDEYKLPEDNFIVELPVSKLEIGYKYFNANDFEILLDNFMQKRDLTSKNILAVAIDTIEGDNTYIYDYKSEFLDNLIGKDYEAIKESIESTLDFGIRNTISSTCPHCQSHNLVSISLMGEGGLSSLIPFRFYNKI